MVAGAGAAGLTPTRTAGSATTDPVPAGVVAAAGTATDDECESNGSAGDDNPVVTERPTGGGVGRAYRDSGGHEQRDNEKNPADRVHRGTVRSPSGPDWT